MLFRLVAASVIVGTIVFLSPMRQGALVPALPDGTDKLAATLVRAGLQDALDASSSPAARESEPAGAAVAAAVVRGVVAEQSERARRVMGTSREIAGKHAASSDTLQPSDRAPGWRGVVAGH